MSPVLLAAVEGGAKIAFVWAIVLGVFLPNVVWMERRVAALIQDRPGPNRVGPFGLFQAPIDVLKMFMKEDVVPLFVDKVLFAVAPLVALIPALTTFAVIPFGAPLPVGQRMVPLVIADVNIGLLYIFALTSLGIYGIVLAGWSSNSKYSLLGGVRASAQIISYELAMGLSATAVLMAAGSLRLSKVVDYQQAHGWNVIPQILGCVIFTVSAFAETNRLPFDLPEAEAELVAGYHTEYSAFRFGMFFMSEYANMIAASAVISTLYFGGWALPWVTFSGIWGAVLSTLVFWVKVTLFLFVFIWVRWTLPRFRYDQLMSLGWKVFLPLSLLNLLWVGGLILAGKL
jgi:NADH-quinone oxidoreductase subunit H